MLLSVVCKSVLPSVIVGVVNVPVKLKLPLPLSVAMFVAFVYHLKADVVAPMLFQIAPNSTPIAKSAVLVLTLGNKTISVPSDLVFNDGTAILVLLK